MRKSRQYLSLPVVTLEEGKEIGRIRGLVINPQAGEIAALIVQRGHIFPEQKVIPYPRVVSVGNNALTIQKASSAERLASLPQILKGSCSLFSSSPPIYGITLSDISGQSLNVLPAPEIAW